MGKIIAEKITIKGIIQSLQTSVIAGSYVVYPFFIIVVLNKNSINPTFAYSIGLFIWIMSTYYMVVECMERRRCKE